MYSRMQSSRVQGRPYSVWSSARMPLACHSLSTSTPSLSKITRSKRSFTPGGMLTRWHQRCSSRAWRFVVMLQVIAAVLTLLLSPADAPAQTVPDRPAAGVNREMGLPGAAGPKDEGVVQRGEQPNPGEVRPGNRDGDRDRKSTRLN